ncbi:cytochrome p450 [Diaporthe amygdali]|uniref:cytochrome p450 n=1 Tax=Phomopsis amygdali TaxID=1214568 RepID=UPI0022FF3FAA|nr:cytochrome p450 [Diaporthe amygdali]KAJ0108738.1 cytochrome p450 [Diaporthe amygdali]
MAARLANPDPIGAGFPLSAPIDKPFVYTVTAFLFVLVVYALQDSKDDLPRLNPKKPFELTTRRLLAEYLAKGKQMLIQGRETYGQKLYRLYSDFGDVIVLPSEFMQEIRNNASLSFLEKAKHDAHGDIPGFQPFDLSKQTVNVINRNLTKALAKLTMPLSQQATTGLQQLLSDSPEWHEITAHVEIARLVSRMSTRIFMGEEMCRNEEWVGAVSDYTRIAFDTANMLRTWPGFMRPIVHWFLPSCQEVRAKLAVARRILQPVVEERKALKAEALARGETLPVFDDAMGWFEKEYGPDHDPVNLQIMLSIVAIDTTTDLLQQTILQIARHPEVVQPLRDEVVEVLGKQGLKKTSLYNLRLMDSVFKEAQRLKPILIGIRRSALADVKLSNGFVIRKGQKIIVDTTNMWDSSSYEDPAKFDPYRFMRWRDEPEKENFAHLVSTSTLHMGFGHGEHACPGRFFAANEVKIALAHLLMKYDWKLPEGHDPQDVNVGSGIVVNPGLRLLVRRRREELDLDSLSE